MIIWEWMTLILMLAALGALVLALLVWRRVRYVVRRLNHAGELAATRHAEVVDVLDRTRDDLMSHHTQVLDRLPKPRPPKGATPKPPAAAKKA